MVEWAGDLGFEVATDDIANLYIRVPAGRRTRRPW